ncbi:unnamed protein product [Aphanomyces euteiches]|nr:hypothetical protein AeRB84_011789 [Aphanomyces euteiches]
MDFAALLREEKRKAAASRKAQEAKKEECQKDVDSKESTPESLPVIEVPPLILEPRQVLGDRLESYRVCNSISSVYHIPNWLSLDEEEAILERVYAVPTSTWVQLRHRRLQVWGGSVTTTYEPSPLPAWLDTLSKALVDMGIFEPANAPNHALINEYTPGDGILPHEDGPMYHSLVAIISLGADARMTFQRHRQIVTTSTPEHFIVERRSLLLFTSEAYTEHLHSIDQVGPNATRVSLTIRKALSN